MVKCQLAHAGALCRAVIFADSLPVDAERSADMLLGSHSLVPLVESLSYLVHRYIPP